MTCWKHESQRCPPGVCGIEGCCRSRTRMAVMGLSGVPWKVFYECGVEQRTERCSVMNYGYYIVHSKQDTF